MSIFPLPRLLFFPEPSHPSVEIEHYVEDEGEHSGYGQVLEEGCHVEDETGLFFSGVDMDFALGEFRVGPRMALAAGLRDVFRVDRRERVFRRSYVVSAVTRRAVGDRLRAELDRYSVETLFVSFDRFRFYPVFLRYGYVTVTF